MAPICCRLSPRSSGPFSNETWFCFENIAPEGGGSAAACKTTPTLPGGVTEAVSRRQLIKLRLTGGAGRPGVYLTQHVRYQTDTWEHNWVTTPSDSQEQLPLLLGETNNISGQMGNGVLVDEDHVPASLLGWTCVILRHADDEEDFRLRRRFWFCDDLLRPVEGCEEEIQPSPPSAGALPLM